MPRYTPFGYAYERETISIPFTTFLSATGQINRWLSHPIADQQELVAVRIIPTTVGTGAGASRVINVRKGTASGTVIGTVTATLANQGTLGVITTGTVTTTAGANRLVDSGTAPDAITIELPSGGTVFTAGGLDLELVWRRKLQAAA